MANDALKNLSNDQMRKLVLQLAEENEKLKAKVASKQVISFKVSKETKAVSVYGINRRFPVTLYGNQWLKLLDKGEDLRKFIETHRDELRWKEEE